MNKIEYIRHLDSHLPCLCQISHYRRHPYWYKTKHTLHGTRLCLCNSHFLVPSIIFGEKIYNLIQKTLNSFFFLIVFICWLNAGNLIFQVNAFKLLLLPQFQGCSVSVGFYYAMPCPQTDLSSISFFLILSSLKVLQPYHSHWLLQILLIGINLFKFIQSKSKSFTLLRLKVNHCLSHHCWMTKISQFFQSMVDLSEIHQINVSKYI